MRGFVYLKNLAVSFRSSRKVCLRELCKCQHLESFRLIGPQSQRLIGQLLGLKLVSYSLIGSYLTGVGTLAAWIVIVNHLG
jgi:hypothetical protein